MISYIFVAAALISIFPVLVIFKININQLMAEPEKLPTVQRKFLIGVALSKILPVILLIFGMVKMTELEKDQLIVPVLMILASLIYGIYYMTSQKHLGKDEKTTYAINTLTFIARPLLFSIPLMAIVFLFLMSR